MRKTSGQEEITPPLQGLPLIDTPVKRATRARKYRCPISLVRKSSGLPSVSSQAQTQDQITNQGPIRTGEFMLAVYLTSASDQAIGLIPSWPSKKRPIRNVT